MYFATPRCLPVFALNSTLFMWVTQHLSRVMLYSYRLELRSCPASCRIEPDIQPRGSIINCLTSQINDKTVLVLVGRYNIFEFRLNSSMVSLNWFNRTLHHPWFEVKLTSWRCSIRPGLLTFVEGIRGGFDFRTVSKYNNISNKLLKKFRSRPDSSSREETRDCIQQLQSLLKSHRSSIRENPFYNDNIKWCANHQV